MVAVFAPCMVLVLIVGLVCSAAAASMLEAIEALPPGQWLELTASADTQIPDTRLDRVFPARDGHPAWGVIGPVAVVKAWGGAAYDTRRRQLILTGGGHTDYGGNEVYAFDLDTLTWRRLTEPSRMVKSGEHQFVTVDDTPVSRHTYDGIEYLPGPDRVFLYGGSEWKSGGAFDRRAWLFDPASATWSAGSTAPLTGFAAVAVHPGSGLVYVRLGKALLSYDPAADLWTSLVNDNWSAPISAAVIEPRTNRLFVASDSDLWFVDLEQPRFLAQRYCYSPTSNCFSKANSQGDASIIRERPGLAVDPVSGLILAWSGGPDVYTVDPETFVWTRIAVQQQGPVPSRWEVSGGRRLKSGGIYGRWRYVPHWDAFIGVSDTDDNVWVYRLDRRGLR